MHKYELGDILGNPEANTIGKVSEIRIVSNAENTCQVTYVICCGGRDFTINEDRAVLYCVKVDSEREKPRSSSTL